MIKSPSQGEPLVSEFPTYFNPQSVPYGYLDEVKTSRFSPNKSRKSLSPLRREQYEQEVENLRQIKQNVQSFSL